MKAPIIALSVLLGGCATADRVQALEEKVVNLEKQVEENILLGFCLKMSPSGFCKPLGCRNQFCLHLY